MISYRSSGFISRQRKKWMPRIKFLFKYEVTGVENFYPQQQLCVSNHNIGILVESFILLDAWESRFQGQYICYAMAHRFFFSFPGVNYFMRKLGCVPANFEAVRAVLKQDHSLLVFPGGNYEAIRHYSEREVCDFNQRKGWIKIALQNQIPVTPISIAGSHSVNPVFYRSRLLSYLLIFPILFRIKWFPISLSQIVYTLIAGLMMAFFLPAWAVGFICYVVFVFSFLVPILPAQIKIHIHTPLNLQSLDLNSPPRPPAELMNDSNFLQLCYDHVTQMIQKKMDQFNQQN